MNLTNHLQHRGLNPGNYNGILLSPSDRTVHFPLWNLSGKLVGYLQYRPEASKERANDPREGRYYTRLHGDKNEKPLGVWGLESLSYMKGIVVIVEGVFDACQLHNLGVPAIAVLSSSYKPHHNWLTCLGRKVYKIEDSEKSKLGPYQAIPLPNGRDDLGESPLDEVAEVLVDHSDILNLSIIEYYMARQIRREFDEKIIEEIRKTANVP